MTPSEALPILTDGEITLEGQFLWGSNSTLLVNITLGDQTIEGVYKPSQGVRPLWDFDAETLAMREVAAYLISESLGWELVPPTVLRDEAPFGTGSVQLYMEHDPEYHYFNFTPEDKEKLRPTVLFDEIINNADRKGGHILFDESHHLWLIDHGISLHEEAKLRTVVWDFAEQPFPEDLCADLAAFCDKLAPQSELIESLSRYLSPREIQALTLRTERLIARGTFPKPPSHTRPYPWPLV